MIRAACLAYAIWVADSRGIPGKWERTIIGGSYVLRWKRINVTLDRVTFVLVRREAPGGFRRLDRDREKERRGGGGARGAFPADRKSERGSLRVIAQQPSCPPLIKRFPRRKRYSGYIYGLPAFDRFLSCSSNVTH